MGTVGRLDSYQRGHAWLSLPLGVIYKLFDDRGPHLAAMVTYYGLVSLFPLLLVFFSAIGFFLQGDAHLRAQLEHSALQNFPIIGPQLRQNVGGVRGSGVALAIGIVGTIYGGLGATQAAQSAFNQIYGTPRNEQPNPIKSRVRSLGLLAVLGTGVLLSTGVTGLLSTANRISAHLGPEMHAAGYLLSFLLNVGLFIVAFRLLTPRGLRLRQVSTGGVIAAVCWELLQTAGTHYLSHELDHAGELYGTFGLVLGTVAWIYVEALVLMVSAEINVVYDQHLWPRALLTPFTDNVQLTDADRRAYTMYATTQRFKGFEQIITDFDRTDRPSST